jgi:acyl-homoserine-lactone acylase
MTLRGCALGAVVAAMPLSLLVATSPTQAEPGDPSGSSTERRGPRYEATVTRTKHGIPHVVAKNWGSLGYGHGYATAETNLCNLADTVVTGRGQRSRWFGPNGRYEDQVTLSATNLQADALFTDIRNRKVVESLLADKKRGPGKQARAMVRGYVAGANQYIRDIGGRRGVKDPACRGAGYIRPDVTALDLWYGVYAANLLASTGVFVPQIVEATPPADDLPLPPLDGDGFPEAPVDLPSSEELLTGLGKDPAAPFGSNATAVGRDATTTGRGMVLGNPHFPWRGRYRFEQAHLTIPGKYDVAGASLIGSPVVNIGWNKRVAWSHTVSTAYRFTPYEYRSVGGGTTYLTDQGPRELERRVVRIKVRRPGGRLATVTEDLYRTPQGYVLDAVDVLMPWTPASFFAIRDANGEHLRTVDTFLEMGKARNVRDLLRRQDRAGGMPWVNTTAADRRGDVVYADHSVVPNVPDDLVQQCATPVGLALFQVAGLPGLDGTRAESDCAWRTDADASRPGIFGPSNLPLARRRDWVANANDSYWLPNPAQRLEGFARIIGCEECERTARTRMVYRYVMDRLAGSDGLARNRKVSPRTLRLFQHTNRVLAAELARENGDLQTVCEAAGGGRACRVLERWDGRSDVGSRGTHLFGEFWLRVPEQGLWQVPFDPADPIATPRDLNEANPQVVQAMREAIDSLRSRGIPLRATWGSLQVAGDDGAPPIPIGGGKGELGNANVTDTRLPGANKKFFSPVSYGSSHIQAVAFRDRGRVDARTILSYGQATDTTSRFSADQTRLFSKERWVDFPFTEREVRKARIDRQVLRGR